MNWNIPKIFWLKNREGDLEYRSAESFVQCSTCPWYERANRASCSPHPRIHSTPSEAGSVQELIRKQVVHPPLILFFLWITYLLRKGVPEAQPIEGFMYKDLRRQGVEMGGEEGGWGIWYSHSSRLWHTVSVDGAQVQPVYIRAQKNHRSLLGCVCWLCRIVRLSTRYLSFSFLQHKH